MDYLNKYLERGDVQRFIGLCRESPAVQGVIAELDEWWLLARRAFELGNKSTFFPASLYLIPEDYFYWMPWVNRSLERELRVPLNPLKEEDLSWKPDGWEVAGRWRCPHDPETPIRLRVCLYPRLSHRENARLPDFGEFSLNYVFESRPVPRLAATSTQLLNPLIGGAGVGVSHGGAGTLGGLLRDAGGQHYGVTCAHVASGNSVVDHPAQADTQRANPIGHVAYSQVPHAFPSGLPISGGNQAAHSNSVDVALIEIDRRLAVRLDVDSLGALAGICPSGSIQQWQPTTFAGRTSNVRTVEFRGQVVYYNVPSGVGTGTVCFERIFEVQWSPGGNSYCSPPIQGGDSGAWLCVSGPQGYEWAAMAVAWDPTLGFAVPASTIETWWSGQGLTLQPM